MYIGKLLKERIEMLNITPADIVNQSFLDTDLVRKILNDEIELEDIDYFSLSILCSVLHCKPEYFSEPGVREKDLVYVGRGQEFESSESMKVRANLQTFVEDFGFVQEVQKETT